MRADFVFNLNTPDYETVLTLSMRILATQANIMVNLVGLKD